MNNSHDEIKKLIKASKLMLSTKQSLNESQNIRKMYDMILESNDSESTFEKINVAKSIEKNTSDSYRDDLKKKPLKGDKSETYRISVGS